MFSYQSGSKGEAYTIRLLLQRYAYSVAPVALLLGIYKPTNEKTSSAIVCHVFLNIYPPRIAKETPTKNTNI